MPGFALRRRSKDWPRQLRGELQARRQFHSGNFAAGPIIFPARPGEIAADDTLHRQRFGFADEHRSAFELIAEWLQPLRKFFEARSNVMIFSKGELLEPKRRDLVQHRAFSWNGIGQDDIESGKPVGRDEEEDVAEIKDFAHFTAAQFRDAGQVDSAERRRVHEVNNDL